MIKIKKLLLCSNNYELKEVEFNHKGITVLIGDSKAGKSSIIQIIDYCLGSSDCDIPAGLIRRSCKWFAVVLEIDSSSLLIARESPGELNVTDRMYFEILQEEKLPDFSKISANRTRKQIVHYFNEHFKLTNISLDSNEYTRDYIPTFRNTIGINFFPQELLLDKNYYFYKQSVGVYDKCFRFMFPYMIELITMEDAITKKAIESIDKKIQILSKTQEKNKEILQEWDYDSKDKLLKCLKFGLLDFDGIPDSFEDRVVLLESINNKNLKELINFSENTLNNYNKELKLLEEKGNKVRLEIMINNSKIETIKKHYKNILEYEEKNSEELESRKISEWLLKDEYIISNIFTNNDNYSMKIYNNILDSLKNEEKNILFYDGIRVSLDKESAELIEHTKNLVSELSSIEQLLNSQKAENQIYKEKASFVKVLYELYGEINVYLKIYKIITDTEGIVNTIMELENQKEIYSAKIDNKHTDEKKQGIELYLQGTLTTILETLSVEYKNAHEHDQPMVWFDIDKIELKFGITRAGVNLSKIGSGSNFVEYHLAMAMLIHIYIQNQVKNKCTVDFVIFDQPSEAYFPTEDETKTINADTLNRNDVSNLKSLFRTISSLQHYHCPDLQIIILEHAGKEYWIDPLLETTYKNVTIIDWKEQKTKLIPENWIPESLKPTTN